VQFIMYLIQSIKVYKYEVLGPHFIYSFPFTRDHNNKHTIIKLHSPRHTAGTEELA
jgi:hypothetical protein